MSSKTISRVVIGAVLVALAIFWIYVFGIATQPDDRIPDKTYTQNAQAICVATRDELQNDGLVNATASSPQQRADIVDRTDAILAVRVQRLRELQPTDQASRDAVTGWLADWDTWLKDRAVWRAKLRNGEDAPFLETQDQYHTPTSETLNTFARVNKMPDCATPLGV